MCLWVFLYRFELHLEDGILLASIEHEVCWKGVSGRMVQLFKAWRDQVDDQLTKMLITAQKEKKMMSFRATFRVRRQTDIQMCTFQNQRHTGRPKCLALILY